jgi:hypothetical protein
VSRWPSARLAAKRAGPGTRRVRNDDGGRGGVDAALQAIAQIQQGKQKLPLGLSLDRCRLLARPFEITLQALAVLTQVVAKSPQLIEGILELARLQPQFALQHRHLAEQGGQVDRSLCVAGRLVIRPPPRLAMPGGPLETVAEIVYQTLSFLGVEDDHRRVHFAPNNRSSRRSVGGCGAKSLLTALNRSSMLGSEWSNSVCASRRRWLQIAS